MAADVMVSYASVDRDRILPFVDWLRGAGVSVWIDRGGIDGAVLWGEEIVKAIEDCRVVIVMASAASLASPNVVREVALAAEGRKPLLPLMIEPVVVPAALRYQLAGIQHLELYGTDPEAAFAAVVRALERCGVAVAPDAPEPDDAPEVKAAPPAKVELVVKLTAVEAANGCVKELTQGDQIYRITFGPGTVDQQVLELTAGTPPRPVQLTVEVETAGPAPVAERPPRLRADLELCQQLSLQTLLYDQVVPLKREHGAITVAMANPNDLPVLDKLRARFGCPIQVVPASEAELRDVLARVAAELQQAAEKPGKQRRARRLHGPGGRAAADGAAPSRPVIEVVSSQGSAVPAGPYYLPPAAQDSRWLWMAALTPFLPVPFFLSYWAAVALLVADQKRLRASNCALASVPSPWFGPAYMFARGAIHGGVGPGVVWVALFGLQVLLFLNWTLGSTIALVAGLAGAR